MAASMRAIPLDVRLEDWSDGGWIRLVAAAASRPERTLSGLGDDVASYPGEVDGNVRVAVFPAVVDRDLGRAAALLADSSRSIGPGRANTSTQFRAPECVSHEHPFRFLICITPDTPVLFRI